MKEKLMWSAIAFLLLLLALAQAQAPARSDQTGRFEVVSGSTPNDRLAFRIDTATGKSWVLVTQGRTGWVPMAEYPEPK